jgi:extradiol dioxygenase family protein
MHLDHINIAAPAELLAKTRDFYCDVIGLAEGFCKDPCGIGVEINFPGESF